MFGIYQIDPAYSLLLSKLLQVFVSLFLIVRFHPFRKHKLYDFDDKIIFCSGLILLSDLGATSVIQSIIKENKNRIMEYVNEYNS